MSFLPIFALFVTLFLLNWVGFYLFYSKKCQKTCDNGKDLLKKLQKEGYIANKSPKLTWEDVYIEQ